MAVSRKRALQDLLARSAPLLDEWNVAGLHGSLKIPMEWIREAQVKYFSTRTEPSFDRRMLCRAEGKLIANFLTNRPDLHFIREMSTKRMTCISKAVFTRLLTNLQSHTWRQKLSSAVTLRY